MDDDAFQAVGSAWLVLEESQDADWLTVLVGCRGSKVSKSDFCRRLDRQSVGRRPC